MEPALSQRARAARSQIASGALRGQALRELVEIVPRVDRDGFVDELLGIDPPPPDEPLPQGAVPYLPCAVDDILAMASDAPVTELETFVDLGSGLGRVAILIHLLTGAPALGIELQEALVARSRAISAELGLDGVRFVHANAADLALVGTRFFLYAPCNGSMLERLLARLEQVARPIVIGAVGLELDQPWLSPRPGSATLNLYDTAQP